MGYTHYLNRPPELNDFGAIALTTKQCCEAIRSLGIDIVGGYGDPNSEPEFGAERIWFNGSSKQTPGVWTAKGDFGIVWPSDKTKPITTTSVTSGNWFGGAQLEKRIAPNGDGAYETLYIPKVYNPREWDNLDENGNYFSFCKTGYRPYDLLVMCAYLAAKYYDRRCEVSSDGEPNEWQIAVGILSKVTMVKEDVLWKVLL